MLLLQCSIHWVSERIMCDLMCCKRAVIVLLFSPENGVKLQALQVSSIILLWTAANRHPCITVHGWT